MNHRICPTYFVPLPAKYVSRKLRGGRPKGRFYAESWHMSFLLLFRRVFNLDIIGCIKLIKLWTGCDYLQNCELRYVENVMEVA